MWRMPLVACMLCLLPPSFEQTRQPAAFVQRIISMQAKEAQAMAAHAAGNADRAIVLMNEAIAIEDSIDTLSQPPYPVIPAHELYGTMLLELGRPGEAMKQFTETLSARPEGRRRSLGSLERRSTQGTDRRR
jgi:hypothetical protein